MITEVTVEYFKFKQLIQLKMFYDKSLVYAWILNFKNIKNFKH